MKLTWDLLGHKIMFLFGIRKLKPKVFALGMTESKNVAFCEFDTQYFAIFKTKRGFSIVLRNPVPYDYLRNRLRISPKFDSEGNEISPEPELIFTNCPKEEYIDWRMLGHLQVYTTETQ